MQKWPWTSFPLNWTAHCIWEFLTLVHWVILLYPSIEDKKKRSVISITVQFSNKWKFSQALIPSQLIIETYIVHVKSWSLYRSMHLYGKQLQFFSWTIITKLWLTFRVCIILLLRCMHMNMFLWIWSFETTCSSTWLEIIYLN